MEKAFKSEVKELNGEKTKIGQKSDATRRPAQKSRVCVIDDDNFDSVSGKRSKVMLIN